MSSFLTCFCMKEGCRKKGFEDPVVLASETYCKEEFLKDEHSFANKGIHVHIQNLLQEI